MRSPSVLLKSVARAALNFVGGGFAGEVALELVPNIARDVWEWWGKGKSESERRAEVEALAQVPAAEYRKQVEAVVAEVAADRPPQERQELAAYLAQVPAAVRQTLRRPGDPSGRTVPPGVRLERPDDLRRLLPASLPHYKAGERPLPGVDWELVELLGVGGFGEVWKAHNPLLDGLPPVALKFCLDPQAKKILRHEATVLNHVMKHGRHPGIVPLLHAYLNAETPCLEYEFVEGGDLGGLVRERPPGDRGLPPAEAAGLVRQLAAVVGHFHRLRPPIVHRDLKPANILVQRGPEGLRCRITDFGIGALTSGHALGATIRNYSQGLVPSLVREGTYTPLYASPQQVQGVAPDPRDDVHALGVIWYQLLTGDLSAGAPTGFRWAAPLRARGLREGEVELLASCFEARPDDRPADALALAEALAALEARPAEPAPPPVVPPVVGGSLRDPLAAGHGVTRLQAPAAVAALPPLPEHVREQQVRHEHLEQELRRLEAVTPELSTELRQRLADQLAEKPHTGMDELCALAPSVPLSVLVPYLQHMRARNALRAEIVPRLQEDLLIVMPEFFAAVGRQSRFPADEWKKWGPHLVDRYAGWEPAEAERHAEKVYAAQLDAWGDEDRWQTARREDTETGYRRYLEKGNAARHHEEAERSLAEKVARRDDADWQTVRSVGTAEALRAYQKAWPQGRHQAEAGEALLRLHDADWDRADAEGTDEAYLRYAAAWPEGGMTSTGREAVAGQLRAKLFGHMKDVELRKRYLRLRTPSLELRDRSHAHGAIFTSTLLLGLATIVGTFLLIFVLTAVLSRFGPSGHLGDSGLSVLSQGSPFLAVGASLVIVLLIVLSLFGGERQRVGQTWSRLGPLPLRAYLGSVKRARRIYLKE